VRARVHACVCASVWMHVCRTGFCNANYKSAHAMLFWIAHMHLNCVFLPLSVEGWARDLLWWQVENSFRVCDTNNGPVMGNVYLTCIESNGKDKQYQKSIVLDSAYGSLHHLQHLTESLVCNPKKPSRPRAPPCLAMSHRHPH